MSEKHVAVVVGGILLLLVVLLFIRIRRSICRFLNSAEIRFSGNSCGVRRAQEKSRKNSQNRLVG